MQRLIERAFIEPFHRLGELAWQVLPAIVTVMVILVLGGFLAWLVRRGVYYLLFAAHFNRRVAETRLARAIDRTLIFRSPADCVARVVHGALWLVIVLLALAAVDTTLTQEMLARFVNYVPDLVTAMLVLLLGSVISKFLARSTLLAAVNAQWAGARLLAGGVRFLVMTLAVVVALEQVRIGRTALLVTFAIIFAGVVIAAAIAFGLGGRDLAHQWLEKRVHSTPPRDEEIFHHL
jgi:mechanosensitive ion channel-like protein